MTTLRENADFVYLPEDQDKFHIEEALGMMFAQMSVDAKKVMAYLDKGSRTGVSLESLEIVFLRQVDRAPTICAILKDEDVLFRSGVDSKGDLTWTRELLDSEDNGPTKEAIAIARENAHCDGIRGGKI